MAVCSGYGVGERVSHDHSRWRPHGRGSREPVPHGALYWDWVTAVAYDPQGELAPTGVLTIWTYGGYWPVDSPFVIVPW
jgi:hypothetical protein